MKMTGRVELLPTIMEEGEVGVARMVEGNNTGVKSGVVRGARVGNPDGGRSRRELG